MGELCFGCRDETKTIGKTVRVPLLSRLRATSMKGFDVYLPGIFRLIGLFS